MRVLALLTSVALLLPGYAAAQVRFPTATPDQIRPTGLGTGYRVEQYPWEEYTERAAFGVVGEVYFVGEPITYRLEVGNLGPGATALLLPTTDPQQLFRIQIDGPRRAVTIPVAFASPVKTRNGTSTGVSWNREMPLEPGEILEVVVSIPSVDLEPGPYRFEIRINGTDGEQRPVRGLIRFSFELRPRSAEYQREILSREATRRFLKDDFVGARQAAAELLRVHPNSVSAYSILSLVADHEGKKKDAAAYRAKVADILRAGRDPLAGRSRRGGIVD